MDLQGVLMQIEDWELLTVAELHAAVSVPSVEYIDEQNYTWGGIADILGNDRTDALREALEFGSTWAIYALSGVPGLKLSRPDIQEKLYLLESSGLVPGAAILARHVRRMQSLLEKNGLEATLEDVQRARDALLLERYKQRNIDEKTDALQAYREAMTLWNGDPETEPKL
jgi:hypothetical protein